MMRIADSCVVMMTLSISFEAMLYVLMQLDGAFDGGLGVELGREGNFEQNVLHHIRAERPPHGERLAAEEHVVVAPVLAVSADG